MQAMRKFKFYYCNCIILWQMGPVLPFLNLMVRSEFSNHVCLPMLLEHKEHICRHILVNEPVSHDHWNHHDKLLCVPGGQKLKGIDTPKSDTDTLMQQAAT